MPGIALNPPHAELPDGFEFSPDGATNRAFDHRWRATAPARSGNGKTGSIPIKIEAFTYSDDPETRPEAFSAADYLAWAQIGSGSYPHALPRDDVPGRC